MTTGCIGVASVRLGLVLSMLSAGLTAAGAQDVSYKDKHLTMIIGSESGGGTDLTGRMLSPYFTKYLPGNPTIVVQNVPGAQGFTGQNQFLNRAKPDGLIFTVGSQTQTDPAVYRKANSTYDPTKYTYVGGVVRGSRFLLINKSSLSRLYDKSKPPVIVGATAGPRTGIIMAMWGIEYLGWNARWVTGYRGSNDIMLALERSEVDMTATGTLSSLKAAMATGKFEIVAQSGTLENGQMVPRPEYPNAPILSEMLKGKFPNKRSQQAFEYWLNVSAVDKYAALAPSTPEPVIKAYRDAFRKISMDPAFLNEGKRLSEDFSTQTGEDLETIVKIVDSTEPESINYITEILRRQGVE